MKKIVLGLAAMALIFVSCSEDKVTSVDTGNPNAIGFEASTGKPATKATINNLVSLKGDASGFGVYASNTATPVEFIANQGYLWNVNKWEWQGTGRMWPTTDAGYPVNFYAYYPKSSATLTAALTQSHTINPAVALQTDLLGARSTNIVARPASSNVALDFKHILSKIDFKVITGAAVTVEVQSIAAKSIGSTNTFNYGTFVWDVATPTANTSFSYMVAPVAAANKFAGATAATAVAGTSGSMMLMPQNLTARAWDKITAPSITATYIEVVYRVYETATGKDIVGYSDASDHPDHTIETGSLFVKVGYPLPTVWEMGKAYTYTIHLGTASSSGGNLTEDKFIDDNGNSTGLNVIDPGTKDPIIVPDPIVEVNKPIGFIVDVTDWDAVTDIPIQ